jgi:DHA2 family lincomycin resistance protein-like MFS transporter
MTAPAPAPAETGRTPVVIRWLVAATFTVILNETIMINAIPRLAEDFDVSYNAAQWLSTAFLLTMAAVIPVTGWFLQRVTTRRAFAISMITFSIGTALALVAPTFWVLLAARIIQAGGTAVMMPLLMTTLMTVVPVQDRGRVMGNVTLAMSVAPALGPAVSGVLLDLGSWRLIFATVLPIAIAVAVVSLRKLENVGEPQAGEIDWLSVVIAALGFGGLVYGLSEFATGDRLRPILIVAVGAVSISLFVVRQLRLQRDGAPLLDLRVLQRGTYRLGLVVMSISFMAMLGAMMLLPLYLQEVRGLSPLKTGLLVMPGGLAMGLLGPRVGAAFDRFGARPLIIPGSVLMVASLFALSRIGTDTPYPLVLGNHVVLMISLAMLFTPIFTLSLGDVPMHLYSHGSSMLGTIQQVAGAFGTALVITVMTAHAKSRVSDGVGQQEAETDGIRLAILTCAVISILVIALVTRMPNRPAVDPHAGPATEPELEAEVEHLDEELEGLEDEELSPGPTAS